ncbi:SRPBCC family protein [Cohnella rhizosphaerae]|uniref:SRPBCC family protein n=1 Tax=Cohnella rhizosphaerae TaxID=1457232 RepID=A0A9X4KR57_9BACL|nr:SRPBCC family protein [Cohnella rhizosphaerae]MDG0809300.1 SRPBCC family protein [Cohnella rhizosphaerae]
MLVRRPVEEVFEAFVDPSVTTRFWFTKSSGRLAEGARVRWEWEMYGAAAEVDVLAIEPNRRIKIRWGDETNGFTQVEWTFTDRGANETFVSVVNSGFQGDGDAVVAQALDSTGGFNMVLCALKALLEHGIELNVVADKAPDAHVRPIK